MNSSPWPRLGAAAIVCTLSACGGGGGGGGGDGAVHGVQVTADRESISMIALNHGPMGTEPVYFTISGGQGTYYAAATSDNDTFTLSFNPDSDTKADVTLTPVNDIAPGTRHTGHITYMLCTDQACTDVVWRHTIPYTMTRYTVAVDSLALTGSVDTAVAPAPLAVAPSDTDHQLVFTSSNPTVVTVDHTNPDQVVLGVPPMGAGVHTFTADIDIGFRSNGNTSPGQGHIPVSVTTASGITPPVIAPLNVTVASTAASLSGQSAVSLVSGQDIAWSAASDRDWLVLDNATGTGAGSVAWHVDTTRLATIANWSSDTATLTFSSAGMTPATTAVVLNKKLPEIHTLATTGVIAGRASTLRVSGRGLSQLSDVSAISVGGVAPVGGSIDGDGAATLQLPALAAGAARVSVPNALGADSRYAALGVTPAGTFSAAMIADPGSKSAMVFDASRSAVYAANLDQGKLVRYQLVAGQWQVTALPMNAAGKLALSPDRSTVYLTVTTSLYEIDAGTMQTRTRYAGPADLGGAYVYGLPLAMTSNLRLWLGGDDQWGPMRYFDMTTGTFGNQPVGTTGGLTQLYSPNYFATPDGSGLMVMNFPTASPRPPNLWYDTATDGVLPNASEPMVTNDVKFDDAGRFMLVDSQTLYRTDTFARVGDASFDAGVNGADAVISPDGTRIYRGVYGADMTIDHIEVFDATTLSSGQSRFVDLGAIALPDKAANCQQALLCDTPGRWAIDPTGTTLFWAGNVGLAVVPIPSAMSGIAQGGRAHAGDALRLRGALGTVSAKPARTQARAGRTH